MELFFLAKNQALNQKSKNSCVTILAMASILITLILLMLNNPSLTSLYSSSKINSANQVMMPPPVSDDLSIADSDSDHNQLERCDIFRGEWIPDPDAPYYSNTTCWAIHEHQNCMKYGRPDSEFMKWRWKPDGDGCELRLMDPFEFLDMLRDKSMAFVGDSVGRNQMQSLICLLSRVEYPVDVSPKTELQFKQYKYVNYNFTLVYFWSPFLVRFEDRGSNGPTNTGLFNVYLDETDDSWTTHIDDFDYLIINAAHWFTRTLVYYQNGNIAGCHYCLLPNVTDLPITYGFRRALRTAFKAINEREKFRGVAFLRTLAPSHFEGGLWNDGGNCVRRRPFRSDETKLEGLNLELYMIQLGGFRVAERERRARWRLMDTTPAMLLRPDGHPSRYGHWPNESVVLYNDCVHWCLPGPIDSWADFLFHMINTEARNSMNHGFSSREKKFN